MATQGRGTAQRTPLVVATVFLVALCLRPALTSVGPVLTEIGHDEGLGESALGALGTVPLLAFAAFSPFVHRLARRLGAERAVLAALLVLSVAVLVRSYAGPAGLWVGTAVAGCAITVGNVLVPAIVKRDYAENVSRATGVYSAFLAGAAAIAAAVSAPLAQALDWRAALAVWALLAVVIAAIWAPRARNPVVVAPAPSAATARTSVWREPTAWLLTAFMGLQALTFYTTVTWLPTIEDSFGVSARTAGIHLFAYQAVGILSGLAIPLLMRRGPNQTRAAVVATVPTLIAVVGLLTAPGLVALWAVLAGLGGGAALVLALSLVGLRARDTAEAAQLSGMTQSFGYLLAATGPVVAGALAEATGGWRAPLVLLALVATVQVLVAVAAGRAELRPGRPAMTV